jgi:hypothetical protein
VVDLDPLGEAWRDFEEATNVTLAYLAYTGQRLSD